MCKDALPEEWDIIREWLPEDLDGLARQHRFFQRRRGLTDAERWLRLILMHVAGGLSLEQTVVRAKELGLAAISGVALFKRLLRAEEWLKRICQHLMAEHQKQVGQHAWPKEYRVRIVDATDVQEPGSTGSAWRLHYSIRLPELICDHYELTDDSEGEKLGRFSFKREDLVIADRGYSHLAGAAKVLDSGAALLLRWHPRIFPIRGKYGKAFPLLPRLRRMSGRTAEEWQVQFGNAGKYYKLRLCAVRKSRLATERARRKAKAKNQEIGSEFLELAEYTLVLTSLPANFSASEVLHLYRCRWQIELAFKRLKSLLAAGHIPKSNDQSARAWMQAKILTALLVERLLLEAKIFSPWGYELREPEPMAVGT